MFPREYQKLLAVTCKLFQYKIKYVHNNSNNMVIKHNSYKNNYYHLDWKFNFLTMVRPSISITLRMKFFITFLPLVLILSNRDQNTICIVDINYTELNYVVRRTTYRYLHIQIWALQISVARLYFKLHGQKWMSMKRADNTANDKLYAPRAQNCRAVVVN